MSWLPVLTSVLLVLNGIRQSQKSEWKTRRHVLWLYCMIAKGSFHSTQNSGNFSCYIKWKRSFWFGPTRIFRTSFEGGPIWLVWSFWPDRNVPFHSTKLLSRVLLFYVLLTRTITKCAVAWVGSVQTECTMPLGTWNFQSFKLEFLLNGKCPKSPLCSKISIPQFCITVFCNCVVPENIHSPPTDGSSD